MKRRTALLKTAYLTPSLWAIPGIVGFIQGCGKDVQLPQELQVFSADEFHLVSSLADTLLPKTESPSASEVKVPQFMDLLLSEVFDDPSKERFLTGLRDFDQDCKDAQGQPFRKLAGDVQTEYLRSIDHQVFTENREHEFYTNFKQLVVRIYYSSEQGVKQNLDYNPVPGPFQGDLAMHPEKKVMTGNDM
jgi:hypothetical protein